MKLLSRINMISIKS